MKKTLNIPRYVAEEWKIEADPDKVAWISIGEPEKHFHHTQNKILDKCSKIKLSFMDVFKKDQVDKVAVPPTIHIARRIVNFILRHKDKNFIVNCAAGVSRSGAVCKFLEDCLGHKWIEFGKELALPNELLYSLMVKAYEEILKDINRVNNN